MNIVSLFKEIDRKHITLNMDFKGMSSIDMEIPNLCINVDGEFMWENNILSLDWSKELDEGEYCLDTDGMVGIISIID